MEIKKIAEVKEHLAAEQEAERKAAEQRLSAKKSTTLAMAKLPSQPTTGETARDGRFIAYGNGTVLDTRTNLMWAAKDNGNDINWANAKSYCDNYRGGGYTDWRMPTQDELAGLYDAGKSRPAECYRSYNIHVATELIDISCFAPWASDVMTREELGIPAAHFNFSTATRYGTKASDIYLFTVLPVRSAK